MKKIVVLSPGLSLPRYIKRVKSFVSDGFEVVVYGYERGNFQNISGYPSGTRIVNLGPMEDARGYLRNFKKSFQDIVPIIKHYKDEDVVYYSFGFIQSVLLFLFSRAPYLYEISDLVYGTFRNPVLRKLLSCIDKMIIKKSRYTIMTSAGFYDYLFPKKNANNIIIQPNKMDVLFKDVNREKKLIRDNIRFGFVGYIRYPNTIFRFARIIGEKYPNHKFLFYGDSIYRDQAIALSESYPNVSFFGKYKNPDDLQKIYDSLDVIVSCYDTTTFNEKVAEPNKLYESLFYCKPMIVSPKTFLAKRVQELECGFELDASIDSSIIYFIEHLSINKLNMMVEHEFSLPLSECIDDPSNITRLVK